MKKLALTCLAAATTALAPHAHAISERDDVPNVNATDTSNPYVAFAASSSFNPVGELSYTNTGSTTASVATGMLVATSTPGVFKYLTAASNVDSAGTGPNGTPDASTYNIYFGAATGNGTSSTASVTVPASAVAISPQWVAGSGSITAGSPQYNLAVITFSLGNVVSGTLPTTTFGFFTTTPLSKTGTLVGYGNYGTGNNFANNAANGVRRGGTNAIDFAGPATTPANTGVTLQTDFDSPHDSTHNTLGSSVPLTFEATAATGDAGGPLLVQNSSGAYLVAGVISNDYSGTGGNVSEYGDRLVAASVIDPSNMQFLAAQGIAVPEPGTWTLLALGALGGGLVARRRRAA